jgi:hypothetical protein
MGKFDTPFTLSRSNLIVLLIPSCKVMLWISLVARGTVAAE